MPSNDRKSIESGMAAHAMAIYRLGGTGPLTVVELPLANATSAWFWENRSRPLTQAIAIGRANYAPRRICPGRPEVPDLARVGANARLRPSEKERANRQGVHCSTPNGSWFGSAGGGRGASSGNVVASWTPPSTEI